MFLVVAQARGYLIVETAEYLYYRVSMWLYRLHVISHQLLRRIKRLPLRLGLVARPLHLTGSGMEAGQGSSVKCTWSGPGIILIVIELNLRFKDPYRATSDGVCDYHRHLIHVRCCFSRIWSRYRQRIQPPVLHSRRVESKQISQNCIIFPWLLYPSIESIRWLLFIGTKSLA